MDVVMFGFDKNCGILSEVRSSKMKVYGRRIELHEGVVFSYDILLWWIKWQRGNNLSYTNPWLK